MAIKEKYEKVNGKPFHKVRIKDIYDRDEFMRLNVLLHDFIHRYFDEIDWGVEWTEEELAKLKEIKARKKGQKRYRRFAGKGTSKDIPSRVRKQLNLN